MARKAGRGADPLGIEALFAPLLAEGLATPVDLRATWTLDDVYDALESLAVMRENQRQAYEAASKNAGRR